MDGDLIGRSTDEHHVGQFQIIVHNVLVAVAPGEIQVRTTIDHVTDFIPIWGRRGGGSSWCVGGSSGSS